MDGSWGKIKMRIAFLGDLAVFENGLLKKDWKKYFESVIDILKSCDIVIANLEVPITAAKHTMVCKGIHLKTTEEIIDVLKYLNVRVVNICNNHIFDYGRRGAYDTVNALKNAGIDFFGINKKCFTIKEFKLSFHSYCCYSTNGAGYMKNENTFGISPLVYNKVINDAEIDKKNGFLSIFSFHWGDEYSCYANELQIKLFHILSRINKCLIYGHHTHVMQGIEFMDNSLAAYSLGNFYFDDCISTVNKKLVIDQSDINKNGFVLIVDFDVGYILKYEIITYRYDNDKFRIINNIERLKTLSNELKDSDSEEYKDKSSNMIAELKKQNLPTKNLSWFFSKMNYYSIGAKLLSYYNMKKYNNEFKYKVKNKDEFI